MMSDISIRFKPNDIVYYYYCIDSIVLIQQGYYVKKLKGRGHQIKTYYGPSEHNPFGGYIYSNVKDLYRSAEEVEQMKQKIIKNMSPRCMNCTYYKEGKCFAFSDKEPKVDCNRIGCMYFKLAED